MIAEPNHPRQPLIRDKDGDLKFKSNAIVKFLLEDGPNDMNRLGRIPGFTQEDWTQFAQLIGYSLSGFMELPYVSEEDKNAAWDSYPLEPAGKLVKNERRRKSR